MNNSLTNVINNSINYPAIIFELANEIISLEKTIDKLNSRVTNLEVILGEREA